MQCLDGKKMLLILNDSEGLFFFVTLVTVLGYETKLFLIADIVRRQEQRLLCLFIKDSKTDYCQGHKLLLSGAHNPPAWNEYRIKVQMLRDLYSFWTG